MSTYTRFADVVYPAHLDDRLDWVPSTITTPIAPLEFDLRARPFADGFARALADLLGMPVDVGVRRKDGLLQTLVELNGSMDDATSCLGPIEDFKTYWLANVRPATLRILDEIRAAADAPLVDQVNALGRIEAGVEEITYLHHTMLLPARAALAAFVRFATCEALVDTELDALALLAARGNASTEAAKKLWRLCGMAREQPRADRLLIDTLERVAQEGEGYGMTESCWHEDATVPFAIASAYTGVPLIYGPAVRLRQADEHRGVLAREVRSRLSRRTAAIGEDYERHLARARSALAVAEDHAPVMHARLAYELRTFAVGLGTNLAGAGRIGDPAAVLDLHVDHFANGQRDNGSSGNGRSAATNPHREPALLDYIRHVFVPDHRHPMSADPGLQGEAGSGGRATGQARRLVRHTDLGSVRAGEVLIAPDNSSIWSFGLPLAAAVLAPGGSRYGHLASLARDYFRPAVVGLSAAELDKIQDGDLLHVDGGVGTVEQDAHRGPE